MKVSLHCGSEGKNAPFMATFSWSSNTYVLSGELYDRLMYGSLPYELNPKREDEIEPFTNLEIRIKVSTC